MASPPSSSKPKKGLRNLLRETLHARSRSKSPSQPPDKSQQPDLERSAGHASNHGGIPSLAASVTTETRASVAKLGHLEDSASGMGSAGVNVTRPAGQPNVVWTRLHASLEELRDSSNVIPLFPSAIDAVLWCQDKLEITARNWPDCEELAAKLTASSDSLVQLLRECATTPPNATLRLIISIQEYTSNLKAKLGNGTDPDAQETKIRNLDLASYYSNMASLFDQLEDTLFDEIDPTNWPTHDSSLTTDPLRRSCTEGTRTGVMRSIEEWLGDTAATSICCISGTVGTGKTTIAHTFCNRANDRKRLAASLFSSHRAPGWDVIGILKAVAYQLTRYSAPFQRALVDSFTKEPGTVPREPLELFQTMVKQPLDKVKHTIPRNSVVVIDGLDACEGEGMQKNIFDILFQSGEGLPVKFLVTSRDRPEIPDGQPSCIIHLDDIPQSVIRSDICRYIGTEIGSIPLTDVQLDQLTDRTGMLFLCATLLVRFIGLDDPRSTSHERLDLVVSMTFESTKKHTYIYGLYAAILRSILGDDANKDYARVVLWTVLFAQEAIDIETIGALAGIDELEHVRLALRPLRPVLHHSEGSGLVSALHESFPDYLLNAEKSGIYFYDLAQHSRMIAERCFDVMKAGLRFNICELESSFTPDRNVQDLAIRVKDNISPTLLYACRHWATHLELAAICDRLVDGLEGFLSHRLLFWMEVLSVKREMRAGVVGLMKVNRWMKVVGSAFPEIGVFVEDAYDFVTSYAANPVSQSTPHIYISSLPFCPRSSRVYRDYSKKTTGLLEFTGGMMDHWETAALAVWRPYVKSVAYSPEGDQIAFGGTGFAGILDAYDGTPLVELPDCHSLSVTSVAFSPDGSKFATGSDNHTIRVWSATDGVPISGPFRGHTNAVTSVAFSPDSKFIASSSMDRTVRIWRVGEATIFIGPLGGCAKFNPPVAFSPDGAYIATSSDDHSILLWNIRTSPPSATKFKGHTSYITAVAFSPDGLKLVSGSYDSTIRVWNTSDGTLLSRIEAPVMSLAISPDGSRIASASYHGIRVWDIDDGTPIAGPFYGRVSAFPAIAYSSDGTRVVACDPFQIWRVRDSLFPPTILPQRMFPYSSVAFTPSDLRIYTASDSGVCAWDASDGSVLVTLPSDVPQPTYSLPLSPDGTRIAVFLDDYSVEVLSTKDGTSIARPFLGHTNIITSASFSANSEYLVTGSKDCTVRVWNLQDETPVGGPFVGHTNDVSLVSLSSDGSRVISSSSNDCSIRVWNVRDSVMHADMHAPAGPRSSPSVDDGPGVFEGWEVQSDGWVTNSDGLLLFWIPLNFTSKPSPHTEWIIDRYGSLNVTKQTLRIGHGWGQCYVDGPIPRTQ